MNNEIQKQNDIIDKVCKQVATFLKEKNISYSGSAFKTSGVFSGMSAIDKIHVRIDDKITRLISGNEYRGDDTMKDLLGYLILERAVRVYLEEASPIIHQCRIADCCYFCKRYKRDIQLCRFHNKYTQDVYTCDTFEMKDKDEIGYLHGIKEECDNMNNNKTMEKTIIEINENINKKGYLSFEKMADNQWVCEWQTYSDETFGNNIRPNFIEGDVKSSPDEALYRLKEKIKGERDDIK
jgi:hypothetical protein